MVQLGAEGGAYFNMNDMWTLMNDHEPPAHGGAPLGVDLGLVPQNDGIHDPDSATPETTPETQESTPGQDAGPRVQYPTGTRPKVRINPTDYLSYTSDSEDSDVPDHDRAFTWDNFGTDLECNVICEDPPSYILAIPLDQAINLDCVLPLTSTPASSSQEARSTSRISAPRRQLPLEVDRREASYLSRLNPFRKRN